MKLSKYLPDGAGARLLINKEGTKVDLFDPVYKNKETKVDFGESKQWKNKSWLANQNKEETNVELFDFGESKQRRNESWFVWFWQIKTKRRFIFVHQSLQEEIETNFWKKNFLYWFYLQLLFLWQKVNKLKDLIYYYKRNRLRFEIKEKVKCERAV